MSSRLKETEFEMSGNHYNEKNAQVGIGIKKAWESLAKYQRYEIIRVERFVVARFDGFNLEEEMQGLILAAGMGKRLKELAQDNTKCMVNGGRLIDRVLL